MPKQTGALWFAGLAALGCVAAPGLRAQYAAPPTTYSVTQINGMFGTPVTMQIYRDGSRAVYDHIQQNGTNTRSIYDLQAHTNYSWDMANPQNGCSAGTYSGDWGDPFNASDVTNLTKTGAKQLGNETVNGFSAKVIEAVDPKSNIKVKVWLETKYGMVVKADMTPPGGGATTTIVETKQLSFAKPNPSLFVLPEPCAKAGPPVHVPTPVERVASETGGSAADFVDAASGAGSPTSCAMLLRFVAAGSMKPLSNFQVALDLNVDFDHPARYVMGGSPSGRTVFSGGHLKEYTAQVQNGVLRVDNVPDHFDMEITFNGGNSGASSALLYRHCAGPQTAMLFVVKNPDKPSDGADWVWVKSGKFATVAGH